MKKRLRVIFLVAKNVVLASMQEKLMYGLLLFSLIFISMSNLPFIMKEFPVLQGQGPLVISLQIGFMSVAVFTALISIFLSASILQDILRPSYLLFFLSKPLRRLDYLLGAILGLATILTFNWLIMTLGLWGSIFFHTGAINLNVVTGMAVLLILIILYMTLVVFFHNFMPNILSGIFAFLVALGGFGSSDLLRLLESSKPLGIFTSSLKVAVWLLPKISGLWAISMNVLGIASIELKAIEPLIHSLVLIVLLNTFSTWRFEKRFG
jgi:ABC-type transport system involved in multi-copper enzyme maturation permease subunit